MDNADEKLLVKLDWYKSDDEPAENPDFVLANAAAPLVIPMVPARCLMAI